MREGGYTLLEATLVLGILGILAGAGFVSTGSGGAFLTALPLELHGVFAQAHLLARARGTPVRVSLRGPGADVAPVVLPGPLRWGMPPRGVPFPPGMAPTVTAHRTGAAHETITLTPRGTATGGAWFITDGRDALCLRLSGTGRLQVLRWRRAHRAWSRV